jgi:hypothetical protein
LKWVLFNKRFIEEQIMMQQRFKFSGHQTFVLRHGWLEKGVELVRNNPHGFLEDDVLIRLGVGKNMVESIKYWCFQMQLIQESEIASELILTPMATFIFAAGGNRHGADEYLEDDATLWLLHWLLIQNSVLSTWQLVFSKLHKPEFTKAELLQSLQKWLLSEKVKVSESTLERDIDCFVRSYAGTRSKLSEENFDSPLLTLGLIQATSESDLYRFNIGPKRNLPAEIVGYAILKNMEATNRVSIHIQDCLYEAKHPGQVFKLDEGSLMDYLDELARLTKGALSVTDTAGLVSITFSAQKVKPGECADSLLKNYYGKAVPK